MKDLAERSKSIPVEDNQKKYYPTVTIEEDRLPELKGKLVGDTGMMKIQYKICGRSEYGNGEIEYRIELRKAELMSKKEKQTDGTE